MLDQIRGCFFLGITTNLTDQHNSFRLRIAQEYFQAIDKVSSVERISADSNAQRLSQANL